MGRIIVIFALAALFGCKKSEVKQPVEYTGPVSEIEKMETFYSEDDKVKVKVLADMVYEYKDGDREFPKGLYLEFYDAFGKIESTLRANEAHFFKEENKWRGRGKVEIKNLAKKNQLNTEELFWKPADKKIFTESFVTIRQEGDVIYGVGLDAKQDMSEYVIHQPKGDFEVNE